MILPLNAARRESVLGKRNDRNDLLRWRTTKTTLVVLSTICTPVKAAPFDVEYVSDVDLFFRTLRPTDVLYLLVRKAHSSPIEIHSLEISNSDRLL